MLKIEDLSLDSSADSNNEQHSCMVFAQKSKGEDCNPDKSRIKFYR